MTTKNLVFPATYLSTRTRALLVTAIIALMLVNLYFRLGAETGIRGLVEAFSGQSYATWGIYAILFDKSFPFINGYFDHEDKVRQKFRFFLFLPICLILFIAFF